MVVIADVGTGSESEGGGRDKLRLAEEVEFILWIISGGTLPTESQRVIIAKRLVSSSSCDGFISVWITRQAAVPVAVSVRAGL